MPEVLDRPHVSKRTAPPRPHAVPRSCILIFLVAAASVSSIVHAADDLLTLSIPARVHLLQSEKDPALHTTLTEDDVKRVLNKVNSIVWSQAKVHIELESIRKTTAINDTNVTKDATYKWVVASAPKDSLLKNGLNIFYVKDLTDNGFYNNATGLIFVKDTAKLMEVPGGIDEPLPRVTSHEIGHALGLQHRQDLTNLMASKKSGYLLNAEEIGIARKTALEKFSLAK